MNILLAPDKFKGSLSAEQVCNALREGLIKKYPDATVISVPLADGGEGTSDLLTRHFHGITINVSVSNPLFENITASYGYAIQERTAFIEMAQASGLERIPRQKQNPLHTTSYGTGELIKDALDRGAEHLVLGIGGSATNDAGIGMAEALGYQYYDRDKRRLVPTGENLIHLDFIRSEYAHARIKEVKFTALCDVTNPLYGSNGAAFAYAAQKGADNHAIVLLDEGLKNFEHVIQKTFARTADFPGAGAGGGMASGAAVFLNAIAMRGMDYMIDVLQLEQKIKEADLIVTGEGKIDAQTLSGKVVAAMVRLANKYHKKIIAVCGQCELRSAELHQTGIHQLISLADPFFSKEESIKNAYQLLKERIAENS